MRRDYTDLSAAWNFGADVWFLVSIERLFQLIRVLLRQVTVHVHVCTSSAVKRDESAGPFPLERIDLF